MPGSEGALGAHDAGGTAGFESAEAFTPSTLEAGCKETFAHWETQIHAIVGLLVSKRLLTLDEMRRGIEALPEAQQVGGLLYYEKWAASTLHLCLERGTLVQGDIDAQLGPPTESDDVVRFMPGTRVQVRHEKLATRWRKPHLRTPGYIFGAVGVVERVVGVFPSPELLAFRHVEGVQPLFRVRFLLRDLWPQAGAQAAQDTIDVEIVQAWLTEAPAEQHTSGEETQPLPSQPPPPALIGSSHVTRGVQSCSARLAVEQAAVDDEVAPPPIAAALIAALLNRPGVITAVELQQATEGVDAWGAAGEGQQLVARAWADPAFKELLLQDAPAACAQLGIASTGSAYYTVLTVVENVARDDDDDGGGGGVHNVVVCTLCSCFPLQLIGRPPSWYKSRSYRSRVVREPRAVLAEFGLTVDETTTVRVHDSTADCRYLVLPARPPGTEGWSEQELLSLVSRDSLVGVAHAHARSPKIGVRL